MQVLSQCCITYTRLSRSVPEIHVHVSGTLSKTKQPPPPPPPPTTTTATTTATKTISLFPCHRYDCDHRGVDGQYRVLRPQTPQAEEPTKAEERTDHQESAKQHETHAVVVLPLDHVQPVMARPLGLERWEW